MILVNPVFTVMTFYKLGVYIYMLLLGTNFTLVKTLKTAGFVFGVTHVCGKILVSCLRPNMICAYDSATFQELPHVNIKAKRQKKPHQTDAMDLASYRLNYKKWLYIISENNIVSQLIEQESGGYCIKEVLTCEKWNVSTVMFIENTLQVGEQFYRFV